MKRYKCQTMIKLLPEAGGDERAAVLAGPAGRIVVRASNPETHATRLYSALFSTSGDAIDDSHLFLTVEVVGDDAAACLAPGQQFTLWCGSDVGRGVVTRRVFV